ncbi:MAG TPA: exonuclease domain-containing protein [Phenylobacterium sp.]|nr:exonuclease domain-containing protein [Phenylobacterium sp.]
MTSPIIRVIDFETTGVEPPAQVVEVGYCDLSRLADGTWEVGEPDSWLCAVDAIPPETRAVHHISLDDVVGAPAFNALQLLEQSSHCAAVAAHNMEFEERWLQADGIIPLICTYKAALRVWPEAPAHSNSVLRYWLEDQGKLALDHNTAMPPHRAGPDAYVTAHVLKALLEAGATGRDMIAWTREPRVFPTCPIGKEWRGKPWAQVDSGFLQWMTRQADMEADLKWNANRELTRRLESA